MERKYLKLFEQFNFIQSEKYLKEVGRDDYRSESEERMVEETIRDGWNTYIETKKEDLLSMSERSIVNFFEAIELEFPRHKDIQRDSSSAADDEGYDELFNEEDDIENEEDYMEELNEELNRLSNELESIPENERQDVVMLMLAFPALREIGFPIDIFMSGDGSAQLNEKQRQQIDWARQLAYKIVEMIEEPKPIPKKQKHDEVRKFAAAFLPTDKIDDVIKEIQTAYEMGG